MFCTRMSKIPTGIVFRGGRVEMEVFDLTKEKEGFRFYGGTVLTP